MLFLFFKLDCHSFEPFNAEHLPCLTLEKLMIVKLLLPAKAFLHLMSYLKILHVKYKSRASMTSTTLMPFLEFSSTLWASLGNQIHFYYILIFLSPVCHHVSHILPVSVLVTLKFLFLHIYSILYYVCLLLYVIPSPLGNLLIWGTLWMLAFHVFHSFYSPCLFPMPDLNTSSLGLSLFHLSQCTLLLLCFLLAQSTSTDRYILHI